MIIIQGEGRGGSSLNCYYFPVLFCFFFLCFFELESSLVATLLISFRYQYLTLKHWFKWFLFVAKECFFRTYWSQMFLKSNFMKRCNWSKRVWFCNVLILYLVLYLFHKIFLTASSSLNLEEMNEENLFRQKCLLFTVRKRKTRQNGNVWDL